MSRHKNRLKKLEARAKPDTYRRHCFIPWERREPLTASEWVELNDIYEDAHQAFQAELARGKVRLLSRGDFRALLKECEAERDFRKLLSIVLEPDVYLFDSGTWDFIEDEAKLQRALEITQKYLRYQTLNDLEMCHRLFPDIEKRHESRADRMFPQQLPPNQHQNQQQSEADSLQYGNDYKELFALELLKNRNDPYRPGLAVFPDDRTDALKAGSLWAKDPLVLATKKRLLEEHGREKFLPTKADFLELIWGRMHGQSTKVERYLELAESYCRASGFTQVPEQGSQGVTSTVDPSRMSKVMIVDSDGRQRG